MLLMPASNTLFRTLIAGLVLIHTVTFPTRAAGVVDTLTEIKIKKTLRIAHEPGVLPFGMKKPDGTLVGFDADMMNAFAKFLSVNPVYMDIKWDGAIPALIAKKFDLIVNAVTITEERAKTVAFSDPYFKAGLTALVAKKHEGKIKRIIELNDPKFVVATQLGTTGDFFVSKTLPKATKKQMDSSHDASNSVLFSKVDAFVFDIPFLKLFEKLHRGKVTLLADTVSEEFFGVVGRKQDKTLIATFNLFLAQWKKNGEYAKAVKRNFEDTDWSKEFPELK